MVNERVYRSGVQESHMILNFLSLLLAIAFINLGSLSGLELFAPVGDGAIDTFAAEEGQGTLWEKLRFLRRLKEGSLG